MAIDFYINIPVWLVWTLGITGGIIITALAVIGFLFLYLFRKGGWG